MKKWVDRKWEDLKAGDNVCLNKDTDHNCVSKIEHIGDRYFKRKSKNPNDTDLTTRYKYDVVEDGECQYLRLEEEPLTDAEKLEKLAELTKLFMDQRTDGTTAHDFFNTNGKLRALIEEYSK